MPYASHRVVGVMELEPSCTIDESNALQARRTLAARAAAAAIRRIGFELAESKSAPRMALEPAVRIDSATLQRELEAEFANLLNSSVSAALN